MIPIEFVSIGYTAADTQITPDLHVRTTLGGGGFSPAVTASTVLDPNRIGLITTIGTDNLGKRAKTYLDKRGINQEGTTIIQDGRTTWIALMEYDDHSRRIAVDFGVSSDFKLTVPISYTNSHYIHLGSGPPKQQLSWLNELRTQCSPRTVFSVDPLEIFIPQFPDDTKEVFRLSDIVFINETEMGLYLQFGSDFPEEKEVVLKLGEKGVIYRHDGRELTFPAPKVEVVHTTGAGEAIAGVFLGLRAQDVPLESALERAVEIASLSVTDYGIENLPELVVKNNNS